KWPLGEACRACQGCLAAVPAEVAAASERAKVKARTVSNSASETRLVLRLKPGKNKSVRKRRKLRKISARRLEQGRIQRTSTRRSLTYPKVSTSTSNRFHILEIGFCIAIMKLLYTVDMPSFSLHATVS